MTNSVGNVCIRCGKVRIFSKTWQEKSGTATLTYSNYVCPDPKCQIIVEKQLAKRVKDKEANEKAREERAQANKRNRSIDFSRKGKNSSVA